MEDEKITAKHSKDNTDAMVRKSKPYEKLRRAYNEGRGTNLTAEDVIKLMRDTAIYDAVFETYAEPEF